MGELFMSALRWGSWLRAANGSCRLKLDDEAHIRPVTFLLAYIDLGP